MTQPVNASAQEVAFLLNPDRDWIFCDFDGTLIDIAGTPDAITIPDGLCETLNAVRRAFGGRFAVVSGRAVDDIARFLPRYEGDIWGAHGATSRRGGAVKEHPLTDSEAVEELHEAMTTIAEDRDALLETKPTGAVVHFRSKPHLEEALKEEVEEVLEDAPEFELHPSKMAWEVRPDDVSKGSVVDHVLSEPGNKARPVVFGDDNTDEEAMVVAQRHGGFGVRIGDGESSAAFRLSGTEEMLRVLDHLLARIRA